MADRNRRSQYDNRQQDYDQRYNRQSEQFSSYNDDDQFGDRNYGSQSRMNRSGSDYGSSYNRQSRQNYDYNQDSNYRGSSYDPLNDYDNASRSRGYTSYDNDREHQYFRPDDFGGEDYSRGSYGSGSYRETGYRSGGGYNRFGNDRDRDGNRDRGFMAKAGDEIASWFGDEDAERRRNRDQREDHRGRGPSNYKRSNERLLEDACERLTHDRNVNASNINVTADNNEITLDGTVDSRNAKRRAEDIMHDISGVTHVQNNLRVDDDMRSTSYRNTSSSSYDTTTSDNTTTTDTTTS